MMNMIRLSMLIFSFWATACSVFAAGSTGQQLANYLGTGSNPRLVLELSANGPNWGAFTIDYQGVGNTPWSSNPAINWSSWDVKDTATPQNYYGTITLLSDGTTVQWNNYVGGSGGYYLDGIHLTYNTNISAYQLTVDQIFPQGGGGPFPDAPVATPAVYPGTQNPIILQVNGDQIVNNKGNPILLKGIVRPSLEWSATGQFLSTQDLSNMANWTFGGSKAETNVIRLDLYQGYWLSSAPATQIGSYKQIINAIVYYSTQLGMAVILDLHWTNAGYQSPMANADSITFWSQVATDYKDFGTVLFELYNEPYGITNDVWLNGDSTYAGYQQLYDAVRGAGAENICIVGGLDYAYDLSFVSESFKVNGTNIVYCSHPYNAKGQPGYAGPGGTFAQNYQGIIGNFPLIFTEFGVNQASYFPTGYEPIYISILQYANANKVNYTGFAWWVQEGDPQFPCMIQDWDGTPLYGGVDVHTDIVQNPGTPLPGSSVAYASFHSISGVAGTPTHFDGSNVGTGLYCWNFGDASSLCTTSPITSNSYATPGSYVVTLTIKKNGVVTAKTSKTIKVGSTTPSPTGVLVCLPQNVQVKRMTCLKRGIQNVITWQGPQSSDDCAPPAHYLVFRDQDLTDLVARIQVKNGTKTYTVKDKSTRKKATYSVVAVDRNGNHSLPVTVTLESHSHHRHPIFCNKSRGKHHFYLKPKQKIPCKNSFSVV